MKMLPTRFIKRFLLVIFIIRTAAERPTAQQPSLYTLNNVPQPVDVDFEAFHLPSLPILQLVEPVYVQKSVILKDDDAGNGNALADFDNPFETPPLANTDGGQISENWFTIWLKENRRMQKQKQKQQQSNFQNQNVELPFAQDNNQNTKFTFQINKIDDNSYPRNNGEYGNDDRENYSVNFEGTFNDMDEEQKNKQDSTDDTKYVKQIKMPNDKEDMDNYKTMLKEPHEIKPNSMLDHQGWYDASSYEWINKFGKQPLYSQNDIAKRMHWRPLKRERTRPKSPPFVPSISAGVITNLGDFFKDLTNNVKFTEKSQLGEDELKLLEGHHPLRMLHEEWINSGDDKTRTESARKTSDLLNALVNYRPSQKIRSLVSMNPRGYHGTQFLDPNYMWVGLGK